jgi:peptidoglycan/xylan/chitin deacetylase (PgdA/CDA1 family)
LTELMVQLPALAVKPIPDRLVVMTFDDSVRSHYTVARPLLKKYGFSATFFVTEGFTFQTNKSDYMTWQEIRQLHDDGFEIGNHTGSHMSVTPETAERLAAELDVIDKRCAEHGIPKPISFAWPGNAFAREGLPVLEKHGIKFARRGGNPEFDQWSGKGYAYDFTRDHHYLIPSVAVPLPKWALHDLIESVAQARDGRIAVIQFHGVPEGEHAYVNTPREIFEAFLKYLHDHRYTVIAVRDLGKYVDPARSPDDPWAVIQERTARRKATEAIEAGRRSRAAAPAEKSSSDR